MSSIVLRAGWSVRDAGLNVCTTLGAVIDITAGKPHFVDCRIIVGLALVEPAGGSGSISRRGRAGQKCVGSTDCYRGVYALRMRLLCNSWAATREFPAVAAQPC